MISQLCVVFAPGSDNTTRDSNYKLKSNKFACTSNKICCVKIGYFFNKHTCILTNPTSVFVGPGNRLWRTCKPCASISPTPAESHTGTGNHMREAGNRSRMKRIAR